MIGTILCIFATVMSIASLAIDRLVVKRLRAENDGLQEVIQNLEGELFERSVSMATKEICRDEIAKRN